MNSIRTESVGESTGAAVGDSWRPEMFSLIRSLRIVSERSPNTIIATIPQPSGQPSGTPFDHLPVSVKRHACLIAAAPELLAVLREMLPRFNALRERIVDGESDLSIRARAAIRAATGEAK